MLQLIDIRKAYTTAAFTQVALDDVSVAFRDSEFAAILGPSGSGKTTLLNILGGLDHADSGDIVINGVSTKDYTDKDWDAYRNHRIGFIFQSYNLIPHQTVIANVELALTLAGLPASERRSRALEALERVGLAQHADKLPSQLSGGQMQRVAIARALVNDPDIVLADEPTGALDTDTGIQVMELLKEIAQNRLVVMVTHNPELAEQYATRIIRLRDGRIVDDTNPLVEGKEGQEGADERGSARSGVSDATRHASMSFFTALSLSFNNLMTKKGRTFMTAFAGSIGIIGIAAILALSNGVNSYIATTEEEALSSYPLTITKSSFDISSLMLASMGTSTDEGEEGQGQEAKKDRLIPQSSILTDMFAQVKNNDLRAFKKFLDSGTSGIEPYVNSVQYSYGLQPNIYKSDASAGVVKLNPSRMGSTLTNGLAGSAFLGGSSMSSFTELLDDQRLLDQSLELVEGRWPERYDECVFVLARGGYVTDYTLYSLGVYDTKVMDEMTTKALAGEEVEFPKTYEDFTLDDALALHFAVVPASALYQRNEGQGTWTDMTSDKDYMRRLIADDAIDLHVVGVVKRSENASSSGVPEGIGYTSALTFKLMDEAAQSAIVRQQRADSSVDVFTGKTFEELQDEESRNFDLKDAFSIDEEALKSAFTFDTSALENLASGMDFSDLDLGSAMGDFDLSEMDLSNMDLSDLGDMDLSSMDLTGLSDVDLSAMELDTSQLAALFDEESLRQIMEGVPPFSIDEALEGVEIEGLTDEQRTQLEEAGKQLVPGFVSWIVTNRKLVIGEQPDLLALLQEYLQTDEAKAIVDPIVQSASTDLNDVINQIMANYMTKRLAPYFAQTMGSIMEEATKIIGQQIAQVMAAQLTQAVATQLSQVMATRLTEAISAQVAAATGQIGTQLGEAISSQLSSQMEGLGEKLQGAFSVDADAFARAIKFNMTQEDLASLLTNYMYADELTFESNLSKLGYAERENPDSVSIYPKDFEAKEEVLRVVDDYNERMEKEGREDATIQYSDIAGVLMSSVTDIVNTISLVLIAFVSISLVVSSIMISIITYISVLERKKEIGILRAMGASKLNVANVFNAETVLEGFFAGVLAVTLVYVASVPVNALVYKLKDVPDIMQLPVDNALVLVAISVVLTLVAGLIPSSAAARRDPVEALRSE